MERALRALCLAALLACLMGKPTAERKDRVHHERPLSDKPHDDDDDFDYDHEAFLGSEDEARTFDQLTPEESKERLGLMVDKIDADHDGLVTEDELREWIKFAQRRWLVEDADKQWNSHDLDVDGHISWDEYKNVTYSSLSDEEIDEDEDEPYEQLIIRDERRFKTADLDKDGHLDKDEFSAFLHPEEFEQMKDLVITETLEDIDKNGDGEIDVEEYIGDMYNPEDDYEEPDWLNSERQQFSDFRDKNKDGKMDRDEVAAWILPSDYDHADSEAKHLLFESDTNKDGKLTKDEIVDKYDLFVGSQATDFGEALARHDEF